MFFQFNQVHLEICSDVNDACCDTCMDSMANDFRGENAVLNEIWWHLYENILLDSMANDFRGENVVLTIDIVIVIGRE